MIRRIGAPPRAEKKYRSRPGAYALLPLGNELIVTAQTEPEIDIQLPGGGIDPGESPLQALHREVLEEIGWRVARPVRLGAYRRFVFMPEYDLWAEKICHVYLAHPVAQIAEPTEDIHETLHLPFAEALFALGNDGERAFLRQWLDTARG